VLAKIDEEVRSTRACDEDDTVDERPMRKCTHASSCVWSVLVVGGTPFLGMAVFATSRKLGLF